MGCAQRIMISTRRVRYRSNGCAWTAIGAAIRAITKARRGMAYLGSSSGQDETAGRHRFSEPTVDCQSGACGGDAGLQSATATTRYARRQLIPDRGRHAIDWLDRPHRIAGNMSSLSYALPNLESARGPGESCEVAQILQLQHVPCVHRPYGASALTPPALTVLHPVSRALAGLIGQGCEFRVALCDIHRRFAVLDLRIDQIGETHRRAHRQAMAIVVMPVLNGTTVRND